MKVTFIGSGNVASHMARAMFAAGFEIAEIWSRNPENAAALAALVQASPVSAPGKLSEADLYVVSVKDDQIKHVTAELNIGGALIVHTSGATPLDVFKEMFENFGVIYPLQTFSKAKEVDFSEVPVCIEGGNARSLQLIESIARQLSSRVYKIDTPSRQVLHLAAVFSCNFTNHLYSLSELLLRAKGLDFELLRPLIKETADKVMKDLPESAQTGPAIRGDDTTIQSHLTALAGLPQLREIYETLSNSIKKNHE